MANLKKSNTPQDLQSFPYPDDHLSKNQKGLEGGAESIRQTRKITFLDFPFDIRFIIYKAFFGLQAFSDREWQTYLRGSPAESPVGTMRKDFMQ